MSDFLIGLQWAGIAFGIFVLMLIGGLIAYAAIRLVYGPSLGGDDVGAPEGDARHFHLRAVEDEFRREDN